jgi:hypothetical protein
VTKRTLFAIVLAASTPAVADYTATVMPVRPLTMSDPSGLSSVAAEVQITKWTETPPGSVVDITNVTVDIAADIRLAPHWLLLLRIPVSHADLDGDPATVNVDCCSTTLGNLTVGGRGLWSSMFPSGVRRVVGGELAVSFPTASDEGDRRVSGAAGEFARLTHDRGRYAPDTTTIRLTGLAQLYGRRFLLHGEVGLQAFLFDDDRPGDPGAELGVRLALATGVRATPKVAILAELSSLLISNESAASIDLGVRYGSRRALFGARVFVPIAGGARDFDMLGVGFDAGGRF